MSVVYPCGHVAGWELPLTAISQNIASLAKDKNSKFEVWFLCTSLLHHHKVEKLLVEPSYIEDCLYLEKTYTSITANILSETMEDAR